MALPLSASSPAYLHILQNLSLIIICMLFAPFCTIITIYSRVFAPYTSIARRIQHKQQRSASSSPIFQPRVILVTGVGMSKGLSIARAFYRQGHSVIGADFEANGVPVCGRFSTALRTFYRISEPIPGRFGSKDYIEELLRIILKEKVELWVSCSGVASALEDAEAAEAIERRSSCKVIQFGSSVTRLLHEKHSFIQQAQQFGLNVPETHYIASVDDAMAQLYSDKTHLKGRHFIMKSIGLDDSIRADLTVLPRPFLEDTSRYLTRLRPSESRPFVLQQFINGPEFCTHSVVVRGQVVAFVACPSAELLMHYTPLPTTSVLSRAMQRHTELYAEKMGRVTGHFSIDFMLGTDDSESEMMRKLYPIECNPRAHTAVILFSDESEGVVDAYLSVLEDDETNHAKHRATTIPSNTMGYYWIGHDIINCVLLPLLSTLTLKASLSSLLDKWKEFLKHVLYWKDGTYEVWDPWPFWWLYCIYWPGMFLSALLTRKWWSRCNVSTTKMFSC